ncbi:MAG TPA: hypothetical protein VM103_00870 [Candidatus Paceibacterota bacterium]|nr:hypothetical protein [Candidatus Paceibacterota bacterium]
MSGSFLVGKKLKQKGNSMHIRLWMMLDVAHGYELQLEAYGGFAFPPSRMTALIRVFKKWPHARSPMREPRIVSTLHFDSAEYTEFEVRIAVVVFALQDDSGVLEEFCRIPVYKVLQSSLENLEERVRKLAVNHCKRYARRVSFEMRKEH